MIIETRTDALKPGDQLSNGQRITAVDLRPDGNVVVEWIVNGTHGGQIVPADKLVPRWIADESDEAVSLWLDEAELRHGTQ